MKKKRKVILSLIFLPLIILFIGLITFEFGGYFFIKNSEKNLFISEIKSAPKLADRFYELYEITHSIKLENHNHFKSFFKRLINSHNKFDCECSNSIYSMTHYYGIKKILLSNYLERFVTQKECLNYNAKNTDFLYGNTGISEASIYYFSKSFENLNDTEYVKLVLMMDNPSLYNTKRRMEMLNEKAEQIIKNIK